MTQNETSPFAGVETIEPPPPDEPIGSESNNSSGSHEPATVRSPAERTETAEDALEAILREPAPLPPQWPAARALWMSPFRPRETAVRTQRVPLGAAWLLHMGMAFTGFVVILICVTIDDVNTLNPVRVLSEAWRVLGELPAEFSRDPAIATVSLVLFVAMVELGFAALGVLVSPWGARDERPMATIRNGLRRVWLSSGHLVLGIAIVGLTIALLENSYERWVSTNPRPVWLSPPMPPALAPGEPGYDEAAAAFAKVQVEFQEKSKNQFAEFRRWRDVQPWHLDNREPICVATGFACFGWYFVALLGGVGAPRRIRTRWTDPICGSCGTELGDLSPDERCRVCGVDPSDEPSKYDALDTRCIDCGYNLTGMTEKDRCPECGKPHPESTRIQLFCHTCRYDLQGSDAGGRCSECGTPVMDSVGVLADRGVRRPIRGGVYRGSWSVLLSAIRNPRALGRSLVLTNDKRWHRRVLAAHLPLIFFVAAMVLPTVAIVMGGAEFAREQVGEFVLIGCVFGTFITLGTLAFVLLAAGFVGLGLSARAGRNLAAPAMQVACLFAGYLLVWEVFGAGLGLTFGKLADLGVFRDLANRVRFGEGFLISASWFIPNALVGLYFMTLVWKTAWASRFSNH